MNWPTLIKVAGYHLVDRLSYTAFPWAILALNFAFALAIAIASPPAPGHFYSGALASIYIYFFAAGAISIRSLSLAFALGVSRRAYFAGTALLTVAMGTVYGLALTGLQAIERATGGWGVGLHFFQVVFILDGPWYLTWLTSFTGLVLLFVYGLWTGLVYRRWNLVGLFIFGAAQVTLAGIGLVAVTSAHAWPAIGRFLATVTAVGLTGLLVALAIVLLAGGYATMRRVTV